MAIRKVLLLGLMITAGYVVIITKNNELRLLQLFLTSLLLYTFLPLFQPPRETPEKLHISISMLCFLNATYLVSCLGEPSSCNYAKDMPAIIHYVIPGTLLVLTFLAIKHEDYRKFGGVIQFAGLPSRLGFIVLLIMMFPKPVGGAEQSAWYLMIVTIFFTSVVPSMWLQTTLLTRKTGLRSLSIMAQMYWKSKRGVIISAAVLMGAGYILFQSKKISIFNPGLLPYFIATMTSIILCNILSILLPPLALVLTSSISSNLIEEVCRAMLPHRTVALLDDKILGETMYFSQINNIRTISAVDWKKVVHNLVEAVPIVIVDTRLITDFTQYETGIMLDSKNIDKAFFLANDLGQCPTFEAFTKKIGELQPICVKFYQLSPLLKQVTQSGKLINLRYFQSNFNRISQRQSEIDTQLAAIRNNTGCKQARLDDLFFNFPTEWQYSKVETGHWLFMPFGVDKSIHIRARFFNVGQERMGSSSELMHEIEAKAMEHRWTLRTKSTMTISPKIDAVDVVAEARNGVTHRFVNFYYNGLEYFIEIKTDTSQLYNMAKPLFDVWIRSFHLRE